MHPVRSWLISAIVAAASSMSMPARAAEPDDPVNLVVLKTVDKARLKRGMKQLSVGLGAMCSRCHVKDAYESDDKPAKIAARVFIREALAAKTADDRREALAKMLVALDRNDANDEPKVWSAIDLWKPPR
jgi:cytochrome c553